MITVVSRAPNDDFTYGLFQTLVATIPTDFEAYYIWTGLQDKFNQFIAETVFHKPTVILGIKDLLDSYQEFDHWSDQTTVGAQQLAKVAQRHPAQQFVIFTSVEHLKLELDLLNIKNIQLIQWGGDIVNQAQEYPTIEPVFDKDFDSDRAFISLNRHPRAHRLVIMSYLFGNNYHNHGLVTYIGQGRFDLPDCILDKISWQFDKRHDRARESILRGYKKFYNNADLKNIDYGEIYPTANNNVDNFVKRLAPLYQKSFVEIVSESSFAAPSYMITEKTLNSMYGCNFPIVLAGVGAVDHLRTVGFDLFDDVVDHSYDKIANPFDRIIAAIENNRRLLIDADYAKQQWRTCQDRFKANITTAQTTMYQWYQTRTTDQFNKIKFN